MSPGFIKQAPYYEFPNVPIETLKSTHTHNFQNPKAFYHTKWQSQQENVLAEKVRLCRLRIRHQQCSIPSINK